MRMHLVTFIAEPRTLATAYPRTWMLDVVGPL